MINYIDCFFVIVIGVSSIIGLVRGFTKEALTVITWIGGGIVAVCFNTRFIYLLPWIKTELIKQVIVGIILFLLVVVCGSFINDWLSSKVKASRLKYSDRFLGFVLGLLRSFIAIFLFVLIGVNSSLKNNELFMDSYIVRSLATIIEQHLSTLPTTVHAYLDNVLQMAGINLDVRNSSL